MALLEAVQVSSPGGQFEPARNEVPEPIGHIGTCRRYPITEKKERYIEVLQMEAYRSML